MIRVAFLHEYIQKDPPVEDVYMLCSTNIYSLQSTATSKSPFTISTVNTIDKYLQNQWDRARISEHH